MSIILDDLQFKDKLLKYLIQCFSRVDPLTANVQLSTLKILIGKIKTSDTLREYLGHFLALQKINRIQVENIISVSKPLARTPMANVSSIPIRFSLVDRAPEPGSRILLRRSSPEIQFSKDLMVSQSPITQDIWDSVFLSVLNLEDHPGNRAPVHPDQMMLEITYPSALVFLNVLSELHELRPAYRMDTLIQNTMHTTRFKRGTFGAALLPISDIDKLLHYAYRNELVWNPKVAFNLNELINNSMYDIYETSGFRLPTIAEMAMIFEKIRLSRFSNRLRSVYTLNFSSIEFLWDLNFGWERQNSSIAKRFSPEEVDLNEFIYDYLGFYALLTHETGQSVGNLEHALWGYPQDYPDLKNFTSTQLDSNEKPNYAGVPSGSSLLDHQPVNQRWLSLGPDGLFRGLEQEGFVAVRSLSKE